VSGDQSTLQVDRRSSFFFFFTVDSPNCESTLVALFIMLLMGASGRAAPTVTKLFSNQFWERCSLQKQEVYCSWTHPLASTSFSAQLAAEKLSRSSLLCLAWQALTMRRPAKLWNCSNHDTYFTRTTVLDPAPAHGSFAVPLLRTGIQQCSKTISPRTNTLAVHDPCAVVGKGSVL
jgi:hypothetical protein